MNPVLPLSANQSARLERIRSGSATDPHHVLEVLRLEGELDVSALSRAIALLLERHQALRARIVDLDTAPAQRIADSLEPTLATSDVGELQSAVRRAEEVALAPFQIDGKPLVRWHLVRIDERDHLLVVVLHHLVSDGWSLEVVLDELATAYAAFSGKREPELPAIAVSYAEFVAAEQRRMATVPLAESIRFWERELDGDPLPRLELETMPVEADSREAGAAAHRLSLPGRVGAQLPAVSTELRCTPAVVLLAALFAVLYGETGVRDITIISTVANRRLPEEERTVGWLANTLFIRSRVADSMRFSALARELRGSLLASSEHQHVARHEIVRALAPSHYRTPIPFQHVYVDISHREALTTFGSLRATRIPLRRQPMPETKALFLSVQIEGRAVAIETHFRTEVYRSDTVRSLVSALGRLLQAAVENPEATVAALTTTATR